MNELKARGKIKFGKRYTIFSPKDDQPCMDHDRSLGEGVGVRELVAVKIEVSKWPDSVAEDLRRAVDGMQVYLIPVTTQPVQHREETHLMVIDNIDYGVFQVSALEAWVMTEGAARNMAFQELLLFGSRGVVKKLAQVRGRDLAGTELRPCSTMGILPPVRSLPTKAQEDFGGTGITCNSSPTPATDDQYSLCEEIKAGNVFPFAEPEGRVVSRSGDECIVALCDQWYIDYGAEDWKETAKM